MCDQSDCPSSDCLNFIRSIKLKTHIVFAKQEASQEAPLLIMNELILHFK